MRELDRGEEFIVTRNGVPIGELRPVGSRHFVSTAALQKALGGAAKVDYERFREDVDSYVDQDPTPRLWRES
jgi:antitoxin (DNA-binding transcriptional repressor) of toxin-antitoxin stability system